MLSQAELDEMSGVLHCEEEDNLTAFSYFLEVNNQHIYYISIGYTTRNG